MGYGRGQAGTVAAATAGANTECLSLRPRRTEWDFPTEPNLTKFSLQLASHCYTCYLRSYLQPAARAVPVCRILILILIHTPTCLGGPGALN